MRLGGNERKLDDGAGRRAPGAEGAGEGGLACSGSAGCGPVGGAGALVPGLEPRTDAGKQTAAGRPGSSVQGGRRRDGSVFQSAGGYTGQSQPHTTLA